MNATYIRRPLRGVRATAMVIAAGIATVVVTSISLQPVPAGAEPPSEATGTVDIEVRDNGQGLRERARESLDYLIETYGISEDEALQRLELQLRSPDVIAAAKAAVGDELLDVWLDQTDGGKLTFLTSNPAEVSAAIQAESSGRVKVVTSLHSAAELRAFETDVKARLADIADVKVGVDRRRGEIQVLYSGKSNALGNKVRETVAALSKQSVPIRAAISPVENPGQPRDCTIFQCDTPIRGGTRLHVRRDNGGWGSCTTGFNIAGSNGWKYILTAGHCVTTPGPKRQFMYHNGLPAVWEKNASGSAEDPNSPTDTNYFRDDFMDTSGRYDYALLPFQTAGLGWADYWLNNRPGHNWVLSKCISGGANSCTSGVYAITGLYSYDAISEGWVICSTGTGSEAIYSSNAGYTPGTRCGEITDKTMTDYDSSWPWGWGLEANICTRSGDSGGPLFSQVDSKAYGILSGGVPASGACAVGEKSVYTSIDEALQNLTSRTGITMSLITSVNG